MPLSKSTKGRRKTVRFKTQDLRNSRRSALAVPPRPHPFSCLHSLANLQRPSSRPTARPPRLGGALLGSGKRGARETAKGPPVSLSASRFTEEGAWWQAPRKSSAGFVFSGKGLWLIYKGAFGDVTAEKIDGNGQWVP